MIKLGGERTVWIVLGVLGLVALALLAGWAIPSYIRASEAAEKWRTESDELARLHSISPRLPSGKSVNERATYRAWIDEQADMVDSYFYDRTAVLKASLTGDDETPAPSYFKEAYSVALLNQRARLSKNSSRMKVEALDGAFPTYKWVNGPALPDPKDYESILVNYWTYVHLYRIWLDGGVRIVRGVRVGQSVYLNEKFDGLPIQATLVLDPKDIRSLLDKMLLVAPTAGGRPVIQLKKLDIQPVPGATKDASTCTVVLDGYVLLFRKDKAS